jgi:hypothetical protein
MDQAELADTGPECLASELRPVVARSAWRTETVLAADSAGAPSSLAQTSTSDGNGNTTPKAVGPKYHTSVVAR